MTLTPNFHLLTPEQQETYLVHLLQEKQKEIDKVKWLLAVVRRKLTN